jgi:hypothetical protein
VPVVGGATGATTGTCSKRKCRIWWSRIAGTVFPAGVGVSPKEKPPLGAGAAAAAAAGVATGVAPKDGTSGFFATGADGVVCPKENVDLEESVVRGALAVLAGSLALSAAGVWG